MGTQSRFAALLWVFVMPFRSPEAAAQMPEPQFGMTTLREKAEPQVPRRKLRLNGLGLRYQPNDRLSIDTGYRGGFGAGAETPASRGVFIGVKRQFETR